MIDKSEKKDQPKQYKDIGEVLHFIQKTLKAPRGQFNKFGNYYFRSCEDIVEAVKQIMPDSATLKLTDDIVMIGNRFYVKATASLCFAGQCESVTSFAREEESQKGMSAGQLTGATSSYARKYALNGLFMIDDQKDADATNDHGKGEPKAEKAKPQEKPKPELTPEQQFVREWIASRARELEGLLDVQLFNKWNFDFNVNGVLEHKIIKHDGKDYIVPEPTAAWLKGLVDKKLATYNTLNAG